MDADDVSLPERLEKQVKFLQMNECLMVVGSSAHFINPKTSQHSVVNMPESNAEIKVFSRAAHLYTQLSL